MTLCGVVPVAAIVSVFPSIVHIPALQRGHYFAGIAVDRGGEFHSEGQEWSKR